MRPNDIRLAGAVDLSGLRSAPAGGDGGAPAGGSPHVVEVTEATFQQEVVDRSRQVPVLIDFWATWCGPCKQLSPVLERLAAEGNGAWVLAKIDVDANQRIAGAFQVQSIPSVFAVIAGQPVPLFQGALPEQQVRQLVDEVLRVAEQNGVGAGGAAPGGPEPQQDPEWAAAADAVARGDLDAALGAYRKLLERDPQDVEARLAVGRLELVSRTRGVDERAARAAATERPDDVDAQVTVADCDMATGRVDEAIGRLVDVVRRAEGDDRDRAREHLVGLFDLLDPEDPRLAAGRRALANALF